MHSIWQTVAASAASLYHRGCKMGWCFFKEKKKEPKCVHEWVITENLHVTLRNPDLYIMPEVYQTNISRICRCCLKKEYHTVNGHIDQDKAYKIFGGKDA